LLDAAALCSHLLGEGSVHALLAEHRRRLFPDEMFADERPRFGGRVGCGDHAAASAGMWAAS
jgi:hypothetical protein